MSGYIYDCCGGILHGYLDTNFAHERIEMMIIDLYDKFGDRLGYYSNNPLTNEPKINIMYGPLGAKCRTFYLKTETAGYVSSEHSKNLDPHNVYYTFIYDKDGRRIGEICQDEEYEETEIHIKTPDICDGHYCVFKKRVIHEPVLTEYVYKNFNLANKNNFKVNRIVFNDPATVVFWKDGTKTIVKCSDNEDFNPYFGFCAAVTKRVFGNNSQVRKMVESGYYQDVNDGKAKKKTAVKTKTKTKKEKSKNG